MRKTVLVTGAAGFIGSHMATRLRDLGYRVVALDNESTGLRENVPSGIEYYKGDVTNREDVDNVFKTGIDAVLHIAGMASTILSFSEPDKDLNTNTGGSLNILQACLAYRVPRLLYASSMTVYGHPTSLPVQETDQTRPISYYGIAKYAAERYLLATGQRNDLDFPFRVTAFRMFNVYGERQRLDNPYQGVLGFFLGRVLSKSPITIHSDGEQTRDFVYISDVCDAWIAALDNPSADGQAFNIGCGERITINRLVDAILEANGSTRQTYPVSYGPERPGDQRHMVAGISLAQSRLNWTPRVSLTEGMARTLTWAKAQMAVNAAP